MKRVRMTCAAALCVAGVAWHWAIASPPAEKTSRPARGAPTVTGTISVRSSPNWDQPPLPGMAMLHVELMDTSGKGPHDGILGEETIWLSSGRLPIDFRIAYDPSRIDPTHSYMVRARIVDGEKVLYLNTTPYYVLTRGAPSKVDIVVLPAQIRVR